MLHLYLEAPFAAFRNFTAGSFRSTAEFMTPSAAYGLLLNVAGIEMRQYDDQLPMTTIKQGLPRFRVALGALTFPHAQTVFQQLHNYPVGNTGKENAERAKGNKYNITPTRRAFLSDLKAYVSIDAGAEFENRIANSLGGKSTRTYGLLFLGDSNFLISKLKQVSLIEPVYWFERILSETENGMSSHIMRLTITIDREDMSKTKSDLFAPISLPSSTIPKNAWVEVGY